MSLIGGAYGPCLQCDGRGWKPITGINFNGIPSNANTMPCQSCGGTGRRNSTREDYENDGGSSHSGKGNPTGFVVLFFLVILFAFYHSVSRVDSIIQNYQAQVKIQDQLKHQTFAPDSPAEVQREKEREVRNLKWAQEHRVPPSEVESGD